MLSLDPGNGSRYETESIGSILNPLAENVSGDTRRKRKCVKMKQAHDWPQVPEVAV